MNRELRRVQFPAASTQDDPCVVGVVRSEPNPGQHLPRRQDSINTAFSCYTGCYIPLLQAARKLQFAH